MKWLLIKINIASWGCCRLDIRFWHAYFGMMDLAMLLIFSANNYYLQVQPWENHSWWSFRQMGTNTTSNTTLQLGYTDNGQRMWRWHLRFCKPNYLLCVSRLSFATERRFGGSWPLVWSCTIWSSSMWPRFWPPHNDFKGRVVHHRRRFDRGKNFIQVHRYIRDE